MRASFLGEMGYKPKAQGVDEHTHTHKNTLDLDSFIYIHFPKTPMRERNEEKNQQQSMKEENTLYSHQIMVLFAEDTRNT